MISCRIVESAKKCFFLLEMAKELILIGIEVHSVSWYHLNNKYFKDHFKYYKKKARDGNRRLR